VVSSIVSTPMLADIAAAHGARHESTLTGFKWIWSAALDLERAGAGTFVFGFEEALGYSVTPEVRDKDGISAAVSFADLAAVAVAEGRMVVDLLGDLYLRHGLWVSVPRSVGRPGAKGLADIAGAVDELAASPPGSVAGDAVVAITDYRQGFEARPRHLGAASLVALSLASGGRLLVRPSGTEPKLKIYVDLHRTLAADANWEEADATLSQQARAVAEALVAEIGLGD